MSIEKMYLYPKAGFHPVPNANSVPVDDMGAKVTSVSRDQRGVMGGGH